jgi:putative ABC transport system permease protein
MPSLSWTSARRIAWREMRSSKGKFAFVILSVAVGVAALTGVRGFSGAFRGELLVRARSIMAADLAARMFAQPTPKEQEGLEAMEREGLRLTTVTEMVAMASAEHSLDPLLVSLKAIDPAVYPFYGTVDLLPKAVLRNVLHDNTIVVAEDLLIRLNLKVGDRVKIGDGLFTIAGVVTNEPDRLSGSFAAGPRVIITRKGLEDAGLIAEGNRSNERFLFELPARSSDQQVAAWRERLVALLPEAQVTDYRETNPALTQGLDRATGILSLMSLVALVLGAIGVAMAMRAHLQQRMDTIAIMKSLGAGSSQIMRIYLLQTILLGVLGGLLGVTMGTAVQRFLPVLLRRLINVQPPFTLDWHAVGTGLTAGLLTTLLFTLPPLLDIRKVRPILILRRAVEQTDEPIHKAFWARLRSNWAQLLATVVILLGLSLIAAMLSDSAQTGRTFAAGLGGVLVALLAAAAILLAVLRRFLRGAGLTLPSAIRHGLANLYRPGNPSAALLAAVGLGVMQITTVFLMQQAVVRELRIVSSPKIPNIFLVDIANSEVEGVRKVLTSQPGVTAEPELIPVISSRITNVNGVAAKDLRLTNFPRRMLQSIQLTWSDELPPGTTVLQGEWWKPGSTVPQVAIGQRMSQRLGVTLGSHIVFSAQDKPIDAVVAAIIKSDGQHAYSRAEFILPKAPLQGFPVVWYGGAHVDPKKVGQLERAMFAVYPTVTVIDVAQALETIRQVVLQITVVIQFLSAFSIFAGMVILASSIAGTRYRRIREVVVLKTLGATRPRIATVFSIEFAVLGLVAGFTGVIFATVVARFLQRQMGIEFQLPWITDLAMITGTAVMAVATGWIASHRVLGQKPLEVLREE